MVGDAVGNEVCGVVSVLVSFEFFEIFGSLVDLDNFATLVAF